MKHFYLKKQRVGGLMPSWHFFGSHRMEQLLPLQLVTINWCHFFGRRNCLSFRVGHQLVALLRQPSVGGTSSETIRRWNFFEWNSFFLSSWWPLVGGTSSAAETAYPLELAISWWHFLGSHQLVALLRRPLVGGTSSNGTASSTPVGGH